MREDYEKLERAGVPLIVIAPTDIESVRAYWKRNNIPVIGLADPEREVMMQYGQQFIVPKLGWMPATIGLNADHKVAYIHYGNGQRDIATSTEILELEERLAA